MIYSKKGVSTIVANVLIVLLVIVGVAVIWAVVNPTLDKSAQGVKAADCFSVRLEPQSCDFTSGAVVKRNAGTGPLFKVKLIFTDTNGVTFVSEQPLSPGDLDELESKSFGVGLITPSMPTTGFLTSKAKFNVAAVIGTASAPITCDALSEPITCP